MTRPGEVQGTDPRHACPECNGHRFLADPTGFRWDHAVRCSIRSAEDSRKVADYDATGATGGHRYPVEYAERPVTAAELELLAACGVESGRVAYVAVTRETPRGGITARTFIDTDGFRIDLDAPPTPEPEPTTTEPSTTEPTTEEST